MEFCPKALLLATLSLSTSSVFANYLPQQLELSLGFNHSSHSTSHLHLGVNNQEVERLHETDSGNDIIGGLSYAYNILPWFVAYHDKDLKHSPLQRVWVGLDLMFMNTTQSGDEINSASISNYTYEMEEKTVRLMVNAEVDFNSFWENVFPFVQASAGAARIAANFTDEPNPAQGLSGGNARLADNINYNLAYSLGAGIKFLVKPNLQVGASYLFTDFGLIKTKTHSSSTSLTEPLEDHLYTSSALFNLSYLF